MNNGPIVVITRTGDHEWVLQRGGYDQPRKSVGDDEVMAAVELLPPIRIGETITYSVRPT